MSDYKLLAIDCSSDLCLVVVKSDSGIIEKRTEGARSHSQNILAFIDELMLDAGLDFSQLDAIAVSAGPGSFTGVRLAVSIAKSLAWVDDNKLINLSSLAVIAESYRLNTKPLLNQKLAVLRDAKMQEAYTAVYHLTDTGLELEQAEKLVKLSELASWYQQSCGTALVISDTEQQLVDDLPLMAVNISANALISLAENAIRRGELVEVDKLEPAYLRSKSAWKNIDQQKNKH